MQESKTGDPPATIDPPTRELEPVQEFTRALMSPAQAQAEMATYIAIVDAVLSPEDYSKIGPKDYKRKSGWRKLAKVFAVGDEIVRREVERDERGRPIFAALEVRATDPTGRSTIGYHEAHIMEKCCPTIYREPCPKSRYDNHTCCQPDCTGHVHWSLPGNLPATAHTRAKNRAIADLIGAGEVSAEEMEAVGVEPAQPRRGKGRAPAKAPPRPPRASAKPPEKQWRCSSCKDARPIRGDVRDCPYCGHVRRKNGGEPAPAPAEAAPPPPEPPAPAQEAAEDEEASPAPVVAGIPPEAGDPPEPPESE